MTTSKLHNKKTKQTVVLPLNETVQKEPKAQPRSSKRRDIENYLTLRFKFRYNVINGLVEYCGKAVQDFKLLDDYSLNSIVRAIEDETGHYLGAKKLKEILKSDFTPMFNPIQSYFKNMPKVVGTENIKLLAQTVEVSNTELFEESLTKWLVATVANALESEGCQNQMCLVLTGEQGAFKTKWLNNLCPPTLTKYLFAGKISLDNKDTMILLAEKLIINLDDQLRSLNKKDGETVKTMITQGTMTLRRPYDSSATELPRVASFVGSVNGADFLTDPTGSRRFAPFEVAYIDFEATQRVDMDSVWNEAYTLYKADYRYWFTAEEHTIKFGNNDTFQLHTPEYELLLEHYEPVEWEVAGQHMTNTEIANTLAKYTKQVIRGKQLGEALKKLGFVKRGKKVSGTTIQAYAVKERTTIDWTANTFG